MPAAELPLGLPALGAAIREHSNCREEKLPGPGEDDFSTISPVWHAGARSIPAGFCSDLSIQCRPEGSSEPLSVGKKVRNIHFHCCFKSFSVAGFGNSPGPGEAAAADVSRKEPGRPRGLFAK